MDQLNQFLFLFFSLRKSLVPDRVPPVPTEHMNASTLPDNCSKSLDQLLGSVPFYLINYQN